jgi:glycosyltransferase involved in cell wall biosynthesis
VRPLNIVARVHAYPPEHNAGAEWMLHEMLKALAARGHLPTVWLSRWADTRKPYDLDGVHVIPQGADIGFAVAASRADVLISHLENVDPAAALARGYGVPLALVCHNSFEATLRSLATGSIALAVANSRWMLGEFEEYLHGRTRRPDRMLVVRPPVRAADYQTQPGECITLINCNPAKGAHLLAHLAERMPDRKFLAVRGAYGEQKIPNLPNVITLDHMSGREMRDAVYARTRVLLVGSAYESWGRVGVEAMCSGIPVIAHPTPGLAESLGEAGIFCDRNEPQAWEAALTALDDSAAYRAAARRARARAEALDPTADLSAWCDAIEEVCDAASRARHDGHDRPPRNAADRAGWDAAA